MMAQEKLSHEAKKLAIAAGGTGGHILPAVSLSKWIERFHPETAMRFFCGSRLLEKEIFLSEEIFPKVLPIDGSPLSGTIIRRVMRSGGLGISVFACARYFLGWKPDACLLFGGYASLPVLFAARAMRIPVFVHEQNAVAGKVTRLASSRGAPVFCGWRKCVGLEGGTFRHTGIPTRNFRHLPQEDAWLKLNIEDVPPKGPKVLVLGGSLTSSSVHKLAWRLSDLPEFRTWTFLVLGAGEVFERKDNFVTVPRTWDMGPLYSLADCAISRGGASTLAELALFGIPSIVVPWKEAADDHQTENAVAFAETGYGYIWDEDRDEIETLADRLHKLPALGPRKSPDDMDNEFVRTGAAIWGGIFPEGRCCR